MGFGAATVTRRRSLRLAVTGLLAAAALIVLLVAVFRPDLSRVGALVAATTLTTVAAIAAVEAAILAAGAQKWRMVMRHLRPDLPAPGFRQSLEATTVGTLLGQVVPAQLSTAAARAAMQRRHAGPALAAWATMHEQLLEALALGVAVLVAAGILVAGLQPGPAALAGMAAALVVLLTARPIFAVSAASVGWCARVGPSSLERPLDWLAGALRDSAGLPTRTGAALLALSFLRIAGMILRTVIAFAAVAPQVSPAVVMVAFPLVQAATVLPVLPGGLGAVEWIWTVALSGSGASPAESAEAAIATRVVCLAGFMLVVGTLAAWRLGGRAMRGRSAR